MVGNWELNTEQMIFMLRLNNSILDAYENEDMEKLGDIEASGEYRDLFGDMTFDEAFDRYEEMIGVDL